MCRQFRSTCKLILQLIQHMQPASNIHYWHKVTLELYKYLTFKRF